MQATTKERQQDSDIAKAVSQSLAWQAGYIFSAQQNKRRYTLYLVSRPYKCQPIHPHTIFESFLITLLHLPVKNEAPITTRRMPSHQRLRQPNKQNHIS